MTKGRIISALVLFAFLGAFFSVYQFYLKGKLEEYHNDELLKETLLTTLRELEDAFSGIEPALLKREWRAGVQPWHDALGQRATYFNYGDWVAYEQPPKEGQILKFWYDEVSNKMVWDFNEKALKATGNYTAYPPDIRDNLGVAKLEDLQTYDLTETDVIRQLAGLNYGMEQCQQLFDAKASSVTDISIWKMQDKPEHKGLLSIQTMGVAFTMTMKDFSNYLKELRLADRYFSVEGLRITYPYIGYNVEPQLQVEMLLSQANYMPRPEKQRQGRAALRKTSNSDNDGSEARKKKRKKELGIFAKAWKLFKYYVLATQ